MILGMWCVLWCTISAASSSRLVHAVSVCFIVDLAGRQPGLPATAEGTVCTVNPVPVFFSLSPVRETFFLSLSDSSGCCGGLEAYTWLLLAGVAKMMFGTDCEMRTLLPYFM